METMNVRRNFKSGLFSMIFEEKSELLSLYNAINGSSYGDPGLLEITTIEDVLYMGIKNDKSFIIDRYMNLYEAQSTWNSNMPLRGLFYFSSLYQGYVASRHLDIYSSARLELPFPKYVILYNGTKKEPEHQILRLSDSFKQGSETEEAAANKAGDDEAENDAAGAGEAGKSGGQAALECTAEVYNINYGHNETLMRQCRKLYEYSYLVEAVRKGLSKGMVLAAAIENAVETCIKEGILETFLLKNRAEVKQMILTEYDEERHIQNERELAKEEALRQGRQEGREEGRQEGIRALILDNLEENVPKERILEKLQKRFLLDRETAVRNYDQYASEAEEK